MEKKEARLLPTRARTAEQRRLELSDSRYLRRNPLIIQKITHLKEQERDLSPTTLSERTSPVRFFPDGFEIVDNYSEQSNTNYAKLVLYGLEERVDFYYS